VNCSDEAVERTYAGRELDAVFVGDVIERSECHRERECIARTECDRLRIHRSEHARVRRPTTTTVDSTLRPQLGDAPWWVKRVATTQRREDM